MAFHVDPTKKGKIARLLTKSYAKKRNQCCSSEAYLAHIKVDLIFFLTLFLIIDHFFTVTIVYIHIVVYVCVVVYNVCSIVVVVFSYFIVIMFSCMVKSCNNHHSAVGFTGRCCRWSVRGGGARGHNTSVHAPRACPPRGRAGGSGGTANKRAQNALIHWQQKFGGEKTYECRAGP